MTTPSPVLSHRHEFLRRVLPICIATYLAGVAASYAQHGFLIGGTRGIPLAGDLEVSLWHLLALGFAAGFVMAMVGQATGLVTLPYSMSVLGFNTIHVTPTIQLESLLGPVGALLGNRRSGQANMDFAAVLCIAAAAGGMIGPFVRLHLVRDPVPFRAFVGAAMAWVSLQLLITLLLTWARKDSAPSWQRNGRSEPHENAGGTFSITTLNKSWTALTLSAGGHQWRMSTWGLLSVGIGVGIVSSTLGVGGGFLLVPMLATFFRLPMYVLVAGSIPFVFTLSAVSLIVYNVLLPLLTGQSAATEWAWGCFTASTAIAGSWCGAYWQRFIPDAALRLFLGLLTGVVGVCYLAQWLLPS